MGSSPAYGSLLCPVPCTSARLYSIFMTMASIFRRVGKGAKELRQLEERIQELNWTTELLEG